MTSEERAIIVTKWLAIYKGAAKRGLEFNLTISDMRKLINRKTCMATGIKFYSGNPIDNTQELPWNYKTFERIDETKGYVRGNVIVALHAYNKVKAQLFSDGKFAHLERAIIFKIMEGYDPVEQQVERLIQEKQMLIASLLKARVLAKTQQASIKTRNWIIGILIPLLIIAVIT